MSQRDEIIQRINKASSLADQAVLVAELDAFDRQQRQASAEDRSIDLTDTIVRQTLSPVAVHERSTIDTDWLGEFTAGVDAEQGGQEITVEASMWYRRLSPEVKADAEEFTEQARGMARRTASAYGEAAQGLEQQFLEYVAFLHSREAASGLPQVQQLVDSQENPAQTQMPGEVFDNFAPEVHPINQGVSGTESSDRAPLLQQIEQEGNGAAQAEVPDHHDTAPQPYTYAEVPPGPAESMTARSMFTPTVGLSHMATLDDFRNGTGLFAESASGQCKGCGRAAKDCDGNCCEHCSHGKEAASGLDQVEQTVDPHEVPKPTPLPDEVAYPWVLDENLDEGSEERAKQAAFQRRAAYVAGLTTKDPASLTATERQEILAFTATLQKRADQWSQSGPQYHGPDAANSPFTTPEGTSGTFAEGYAEGRSDWPGEAPTYADASSHATDFVRGHSEGYGDAARQDPAPGAAVPGQLPPGAGNHEYQTHAASKTASRQPLIRTSASFTSKVEEADPDFAKAYRYAAKWKPGKRLVTTGSALFEAGLYAGMSDNPEHQEAWGEAHRTAAKDFGKPEFLRRMAMHRSFTKKAARNIDGFRVVGNYLHPVEVEKTAATSSDLDTMAPGGSPSPTGQTPINGPGTPPPLAGGMDPAAPGGPAPYNGAEPFGAPVVPNSASATGTPTAISDAPGSAVDQAAMERLSPQTLAFRKTVQANLLKQHTDEN